MSEFVEATFRTKTGTCTVTPDRIILTREGVKGAAAGMLYGNSIVRVLFLYGVIGTGFFTFGVWSLLGGNFIAGVPPCLFGTLFLWAVITSRRNSTTPVVERDSIRSVKAHPPRPPATRGYFDVWFQEGGKLRKRLILLPGSLEGGEVEYAKAEAVMRAAGLLPGASAEPDV